MADHQRNPGQRNPEPAHDAARPPQSGVSRRSFIQTLGASAAASSVAAHADTMLKERAQARAETQQDAAIIGPEPAPVSLRINGRAMNLTIDPATTLLEALRWEVQLTGAKSICDRGACGGCSVLVDGKLVASCMMLAVDAIGRDVTTVEGLSRDGQLDAVQQAFVKHDGLQCGFCTPGLVIASRAVLNQNPQPSLEEIKRGLAGNLCRCGTYTNIFNAVLEASGQPVPADVAPPAHAEVQP